LRFARNGRCSAIPGDSAQYFPLFIPFLSVTAPDDENHYISTINQSCAFPLPADGIGNLTNEPSFLDYAGGNLRLQSNSPCINAGNNASVSSDTNLEGLPPIAGGTVDMGAYEFQSPASLWRGSAPVAMVGESAPIGTPGEPGLPLANRPSR
jgi:hypothetical protein